MHWRRGRRGWWDGYRRHPLSWPMQANPRHPSQRRRLSLIDARWACGYQTWCLHIPYLPQIDDYCDTYHAYFVTNLFCTDLVKGSSDVLKEANKWNSLSIAISSKIWLLKHNVNSAYYFLESSMMKVFHHLFKNVYFKSINAWPLKRKRKIITCTNWKSSIVIVANNCWFLGSELFSTIL